MVIERPARIDLYDFPFYAERGAIGRERFFHSMRIDGAREIASGFILVKYGIHVIQSATRRSSAGVYST